ncbi:MAG: HlyD family secretion protein, partial [Candidatus Binataceae bacterium]
MDTFVEDDGEGRFVDSENHRHLRNGAGAAELDSQDPRERAESSDRLEALKPGPIRDLQIELTNEPNRKHGGSGGGPWRKRISWRIALMALAVLAVGAAAPSAWNYLQSYESTDDAQIDGHIDPLSSRIDGTVIRVHVEDDDRVKKGELLVEIDPRDYQAAVEQARARLELARAQAASAKQDYAAALAFIREAEATNFRAQRDARRYAILLEKQVVPPEQYDQYNAIARVDAAKTDSARETAGSALKAIAAREAEVDEAKAALDQALLNLSYTKIYAPANGIVGKRGVQLGSRIEPGQTLMF